MGRKIFTKVLAICAAVVLVALAGVMITGAITSDAHPSKAHTVVSGESKLGSLSAKSDSDSLYEIVTPQAVTKLRAENVTSKSLRLTWKPSSGAMSYVVYRARETESGAMTEYKRYKKLTATSISEKNLLEGKRYSYIVYAARTDLGKTTLSPAQTLDVLTKPNAVAKAKIADRTSSTVKIAWSKKKGADGYLIYRSAEKSNGSFSEYQLVRKCLADKSSFVDAKLKACTVYRYRVVVLRKDGKLKALSSPKSMRAATLLASPEKLKNDKVTTSTAKISWKKVQRADKYEVYRDKKLIKTTKNTSFTDKKLKSGKNYKYSVRALRKSGNKVFRSKFTSINVLSAIAVKTVKGGLTGTWIEVSIPDQTLYMYVNNKLYVKTPVVTGNDGALSTTKGHHQVLSKSSPARLKGSYNGSSWDVTVGYWLGFTYDGQGIHDSTWRSSYGGSIYKYDGSHGCVNTPLDAMRKAYSKAYVGMPVIVY